MNRFTDNIIRRHISTENNIIPRPVARFEQMNEENSGNNEIKIFEQNNQIFGGNQKQSKKESSFKKDESDNAYNLTTDIDSGNDEFKQISSKLNKTINRNVYGHLAINDDTEIVQKNNDSIINNSQIQNHNVDKSNNSIEEPLELQDKKTNEFKSLFVENNQDYFNEIKDTLNQVNKSSYKIIHTQQQKYPAESNFNLKKNIAQNDSPVVKISIGRIDVRAVVSTQPEKKVNNTTQKPNMSLDDYLKKRSDNNQ